MRITFHWEIRMLLHRWFSALFFTFVASTVCSAAPRLNELMASGQAVVADEDGQFPDWVEIYNPDGAELNLTGWHLTDDPAKPAKWIFPQTTVPAGGYLLVFCSEKDRVGASGQLHTNFRLDAGGETLQLRQPDGTLAATLAYPQQIADLSFDGTDFLGIPTPGAANDTTVVAVARAPQFSVTRGFFTTAFALQLTSATPGAAIRYTLDGTEPTLASTRYVAPIPIKKTACVRATTFAEGKRPSSAVTNTYLFLADVVKQSPAGQTPPNWPKSWGANRVDYGMDPRIAQRGKFARDFPGALKDIPSISIVIALPDLFDPATGIYANPEFKGRDWERPTSLELINPDGTPGFQINAGLRIRGGASRSTDNPKHSFRVLMKKEYGAEALEYPLFGPEGARRSEKFDLRCEQLVSWVAFPDENADFIRDIYGRDTQAALGQPAARGNFYHLYINGQYWGLYQTDERIGAEYAAEYFGGSQDDYDTVKINYDFDSTGGGTDFVDGSFGAWRRAVAMGYAGFETNEDYFKIQGLNADGSRNEAFERLIDVDNLIDYMLAGIFIAADDSPPAFGTQNNWYGIRSRRGKFGFRFFAHDWEIAMYDPTGEENRVGAHPAENPFRVSVGGPADANPGPDEETTGLDPTSANPWHFWQAMRFNPEFRLRVADHVQRFFFNDGALTQERAVARWRARMEEIDQAVIGESARWGDARSYGGFPGNQQGGESSLGALLAARREAGEKPRLVKLAPGQDEDDLVETPLNRPPHTGALAGPGEAARPRLKPYTRDTWLRACNEHILGGFLANRTAHVIDHLKAGLLYPSIDAPGVAPFGGPLPVGDQVTITPPLVNDGANPTPVPAQVYFTTNEDDPRLVGGALNSSAQLYTAPLRFAKRTTLKARALNPVTGEWSALVEAVFLPGVDFGGLKISEIFYNPPPPAGRDGEFVEFQNTGATPLDLSGLKVTGEISFTFPAATILPPGEYYVLVRHPATFATLHPGVTANGVFTRALADGGGRIAIETADGARVLSVDYDDEHEWPAAADGFGFSLVYDGRGDADEGTNWFASHDLHGSPGRADNRRVEGQPIIITKIGADAAGPWIEMTNPHATAAIQVGNSWLLHRGQSLRLPQVSLAAGQSLRLGSAELGAFALLPTGGEVAFQYGISPQPAAIEPVPAGYVHRFFYERLTTGLVFGRMVTSDGREYFPRLDASGTAPWQPALRIEEVNYQPRPALSGDPASHEFIEVANHADTPANLDGARMEGFAFVFPAGAQVPAQGRALVVGMDPATFRTLHNVPVEVPIYGPATGSLQDNGERIALEMPVDVGGMVDFSVVEELRYNDKHPWPVAAAGRGHSLQRFQGGNYSAEPASWGSDAPSPGLANVSNAAPQVTLVATGATHEYLAAATDADGAVAKLELIVDGEVVAESDTAPATFTYRPTNGLHDLWARATDDRGAVALSDTITLDASDVPDGAGLGLLAEFYDNPALEGAPAVTQPMRKVGGDWFHLDPAPGIHRTGFSVRYSGKLVPRANGTHDFNFLTTGGLRFYLDGELVIDHWTDDHAAMPSAQSYSAELVGGRASEFVVEYFDDDGLASLSLLWKEAGAFVEGAIPSALFYLPSQNPAAPAIALPAGIERRFLGQRIDAKFVLINAPEDPVAWSIVSGALPPGLTLGVDGTVDGKTAVAGAFTFEVQAIVTPSTGPAVTFSREATIAVVDRAVPAPVIRVLRPSERVANAAPVEASGTAAGPRPITRIRYSLNGSPWHDLPGGSQWNVVLDAQLGLVGGDNLLSVQAEDAEGRLSTVVDHHFTRQFPGTLTVTINGAGRVSTGFLGRSTRIVGQSYVIAAIPAPGYLFSGWDQFGIETPLNFMMSENLVLNANFVPNPFLGAKGTYSGFLGGEETTHRYRGRAALNLTEMGAFTGTLDFAAARYVLNGRLDPQGNASLFPFDPKTGRSLGVMLSFDVLTRAFSISVEVYGGNEIVTIAAPLARVPWSANRPCPYRGRWSVTLPPAADPAPQGHGFITMTVSSRGIIRSTARLADGKMATQGGWVDESGALPFYAMLEYDQQTTIGESLSGVLQFPAGSDPQLMGTLLWAKAGDPLIIIGHEEAEPVEIFARTIDAIGSRYRMPPPGGLALNLPAGTFTLTGPDPGFSITKPVRLNQAHVFVFPQPDPAHASLGINPENGRVTGKITLGTGTTAEAVALHGLADQWTKSVRGFFVDKAGQTGAFEIHP